MAAKVLPAQLMNLATGLSDAVAYFLAHSTYYMSCVAPPPVLPHILLDLLVLGHLSAQSQLSSRGPQSDVQDLL